MRKYIFVTGGAVSDLGKTVLSASIGLLLSKRGFNVVNKKLSPYMNVSMGALRPDMFGEVFVTSDGAETDLSLGFYERFTGTKTDNSCFATSGNIYWSVINKERMGDFSDEAVTVSSHVAEEIKEFICKADADIVITEVGGTVGDVESVHFLDAIGKMKEAVNSENVMYIHVENIPSLVASEEERVASVNHSTAELLERGIQPDVIVCRTEKQMENSLSDKISIFCNINKEAVIDWQITDILYELPLLLEKSGFSNQLLKKLALKDYKPKLDAWKNFAAKARKAEREVKIAVVGKSASLKSAYQSIKEALECAAFSRDAKALIEWIDSNNINEKNVRELLASADGIVIPDGKGKGGTEGMMIASSYAREEDIPFLAIGQGMHTAVISFASEVLGLKGAQSEEIGVAPYPVAVECDLHIGEEKIKISRGTKVFSAYGRELFCERCRHKYMINVAYKTKLEEKGMVFAGLSQENGICEVVEMCGKRFYIGTQFNPELSSSPEKIHPLFSAFVEECLL